MSGPVPVRPLHVTETWLPVVSGYTTRGAALVAAQSRRTDLSPRVLVTSRQMVHGSTVADTTIDGADLDGRLRLLPPCEHERRRRHLRRWSVHEECLTRAVGDAAEQMGADLVHVHWSSTIGAAAATAARRRGLPLVAEVRFDLAGAVTAQTARVPTTQGRQWLERRLRQTFERHLAGADAVIAASATLATLLADAIPGVANRLTVVGNGCEPQRFTPAPRDPRLVKDLGLDGRTVIGTTATMLRYEGLDLLVAAVARLVDDHPDVALLLVGDGPEARRLMRSARRAGVRCVLTGRVPATEVAALYQVMDVVAVPRRDLAVTRYAAPVKLLEAMAAGRPTVASAVGDIPRLLADGRGRLVPPGDVAALAAALSAMLVDPADRQAYGWAARQWAEQAPSWDDTAVSTLGVYRTTTGQSP